MSIFDKLNKNHSSSKVDTTSETFVFASLPESLMQMQMLEEATLENPFATAALSVCAICAYAADKQIGLEMLNWLRGPRPLANGEIAFLDERFKEGKTYIPFSYFKGASPTNYYTPHEPYTITIESNLYSDVNEGYKKLFVRSSGSENPREIVLRKRGDGKWFLWNQVILVGIKEPQANDPWA